MKAVVTDLMELRDAMKNVDERDVLTLVLKTPGDQAFRFIVTRHGIERQPCDKNGDPRR